MNRARQLAVQCAREAGRSDLADDAALVISELVTNAVLHGGGCSGLSIVPVKGGVRVEVHDRSPVPPVFGHATPDALTGRGMHVVDALCSRWGVESESGGKVVWAEITGDSPALEAGLSEADLLAMWGDLEERGGGRHFHMELGNVPTDLLLAAKSHVDNVVRELSLVWAGAESGVTGEVPAHLSSVLQTIERFADARAAIKRQALDSARRGGESTRLTLDLPASAADAAEEYLQALDQIDAYCRAKRLLTLETPPQHRVFRQWYVGELVSQLRAAAAGNPAPPVQTFERRLLAELDFLASAQRASDRAARLYTVVSALATADTPEEVAEAVLNEGAAALGASGGGVWLVVGADRFALPGTVGYDEELVARLRGESRDAELPAAIALRTGESVWLESRAERDRCFPELAGLEAATVALCAVPLEVRGRTLGALRFSFTEARLFDESERRFVLALAAQAAQALDRTHLQQARIDVSRRLQRSLLPPELPPIPGLDVAAMYQAFGDGVDIGGDFYDLWPIKPGHWAIALGDASGTGPEAAALTALARHTLRALTIDDSDPVRVVATLNKALFDAIDASGEDRFCTVVFGVISTVTGVEVVLASGGRPPLVVRRANGVIETVQVGGTLLGVFADAAVGSQRVRLEPGDTAVLVTDGVLEARHNGTMFEVEGIERVLAWCGEAGADEVCRALEEAVLSHNAGLLTDDMAAMVLRVPAGPGPGGS